MKCPHCGVAFHDALKITELDRDKDGLWGALTRKCPECDRLIVSMAKIKWMRGASKGDSGLRPVSSHRFLWPRTASRDPLPSEVPSEFRKDYEEACRVLSLSPRASAALSRRCLQHILREEARVDPSSLAKEIEQVVEARSLPPYLAEALDEVRVTGNFAAHPVKYKTTGEVVPVEPGEAERNLDILEMLFRFYFVEPAQARKARDDLNRKLVAAGKKPLRDGPPGETGDSGVGDETGAKADGN